MFGPYVGCSWIFVSQCRTPWATIPGTCSASKSGKTWRAPFGPSRPFGRWWESFFSLHCRLQPAWQFLGFKMFEGYSNKSTWISTYPSWRDSQNLFMQDHAGKGQVTTLFNSVQFQIFALDPPYSSLNQVLVKDPAKLNVARFQRISSFLEVVVGLLLGFFLSSSMQRLGIQFVRFQNYNRFDRNHLLLWFCFTGEVTWTARPATEI